MGKWFYAADSRLSYYIADGLKGTDDIAVPVRGGEYIKEAKIGRAIMDADVFISLSHFKGHEMAGFGGAIKNIGMGCGSRAGKKDQHSNGTPTINPELCRGCQRCFRECANQGLVFDEKTHKMTIDTEHCAGCGRCLGACNFDAISFEDYAAVKTLNCRMAEYTKAVLDAVLTSIFHWLWMYLQTVTVMAKMIHRFCQFGNVCLL